MAVLTGHSALGAERASEINDGRLRIGVQPRAALFDSSQAAGVSATTEIDVPLGRVARGQLANRVDGLAICTALKREGSRELDWRPESAPFGSGWPDSTWGGNHRNKRQGSARDRTIRNRSGYMRFEYTCTCNQMVCRARDGTRVGFCERVSGVRGGIDRVLNRLNPGVHGDGRCVERCLQRTTSRTKSWLQRNRRVRASLVAALRTRLAPLNFGPDQASGWPAQGDAAAAVFGSSRATFRMIWRRGMFEMPATTRRSGPSGATGFGDAKA
jgi:hypothetical protein